MINVNIKEKIELEKDPIKKAIALKAIELAQEGNETSTASQLIPYIRDLLKKGKDEI